MDKSRTETTTTETSRGESRIRGFFERAADRVRNAVRNVRRSEETRGRRYARGRFTSSFGGGYDESERWDEGTVHEPMLDWRETTPREYGGYAQRRAASGDAGERRPYREERDEEWGRSGGRGRGW